MFWSRLERCFIIEDVLQTKMLNRSVDRMTKQFLVNRIVYRSQFWNDLIWSSLRNSWYAFFDVLIVSYLFIDHDWRFQNARAWRIDLYENCFTNSFYKNENHDFVQFQLFFFNISILWFLFTFSFFKNHFSDVMFFFFFFEATIYVLILLLKSSKIVLISTFEKFKSFFFLRIQINQLYSTIFDLLISLLSSNYSIKNVAIMYNY